MKKLYTLLTLLSFATGVSHAATKTVKHTIKNGETLYTIAHKNHTTIAEVEKANSLKKGEILKIGRVLKVPVHTYKQKTQAKKLAQKTNKKPTQYVIKSGDTLSGIARKQQTTVAKLRKVNGIKKGQTLKLGKVLKMPKNSYALTAQKKKFKVAKTKTTRQDKTLARALMNTKSKKTATSEKASKFALGDIFFGDSKKSAKITTLAKKKLGRRYVWGAVGQKNTFDCSGLTSYVCKKNGISIPRRAIAQSKHGKYISRNNLQPGDLIFFDTSKRRKGYVNHVGIYLGNDRFIHASSAKKKVVITKLGKSFYSKRYKGARRVTS